jgi:hypothetical protein
MRASAWSARFTVSDTDSGLAIADASRKIGFS